MTLVSLAAKVLTLNCRAVLAVNCRAIVCVAFHALSATCGSAHGQVLISPGSSATATGASGTVESQPTRDTYFGMHIHRADKGTAWPTAKFGSWRLWDAYAGWPEIELERGKWDFSRLDRYVAIAKLSGVDILLPLGRTPTWASSRPTEKSSYSPGQAAEPTNMKDWRNYVRTIGERYRGKVRNYDLWNEVNEKGFYSGSVEKLVELTCEAHRVLHEVSPENRLVSPSFIGAGSEPDQLENFLRMGGKACVDIVGYHFYVPHREPEEILPLVARIQAVMVRQGLADLPLWNTEFGWWMENGDGAPETGADKRWRRVRSSEGAAVLARSLILGRWAGLDRFYWYAWDNQLLGLIEPSNGALKPAGVAYATLVRWMSFSTPNCTASRGAWSCALPTLAGQSRRIAWHTNPHPTAFVSPRGEHLVSVERLDGTQQSVASPKSPTVMLTPEPMLFFTASD